MRVAIWRSSSICERSLDPDEGFPTVTAGRPEPPDGARDDQRLRRISTPDPPRKGGANVVVLEIEPVQPVNLVRSKESTRGFRGQLGHPGGVPLPHRLFLIAGSQPLRRKLLDHFQHDITQLSFVR